MDLLDCKPSMESFRFTLLDTMGFIEVVISKNEVTCSSKGCRASCHHAILIFHKVFNFSSTEALIYKKNFTADEWQEIMNSFPENVPLVKVERPNKDRQEYTISIRSTRNAKCASCRQELVAGDMQASTEGPYRTIQINLIRRTFFFCARLRCMGKLPRFAYIHPFIPGTNLIIETPLTPERMRDLGLG